MYSIHIYFFKKDSKRIKVLLQVFDGFPAKTHLEDYYMCAHIGLSCN